MNITLYELAAEFRQTAEQLADMDLPPEVVQDTLESLQFPVEQKAAHVAAFVRNLESTAEQIRQAEKAMSDRRRSLENRASHIKQYLLDNMMSCGISKIDHPLFRISIRKNPASVVVFDERLVPADYLRDQPPPPPAIDKRLIGQAIKDGHDVPGARLECGQRLEIK